MPGDLSARETGEALAVLSIQVGLPRRYSERSAANPRGQSWTSGIFKRQVDEPVHLGRTNLAGDGQADLENHGGSDKAVLAYPAGHYPLWRADLGMPDLPHGAFGENLTIAGLTEDGVCIGDVFSFGEARLQVSQPRGPCWKIARLWGIKDLTAQVERTGRTGWYLRVLDEGEVQADLPFRLVGRPCPEWTISLASRVMKERESDPRMAAALSECPFLAESWRKTLLSHSQR